MAPLKHIYPIRNEEIINEISETDVKIASLEIEVKWLRSQIKSLHDLIIRQTEINKNIVDVLQNMTNETKVSE